MRRSEDFLGFTHSLSSRDLPNIETSGASRPLRRGTEIAELLEQFADPVPTGEIFWLTGDFLKLLDDSFERDCLKPRT